MALTAEQKKLVEQAKKDPEVRKALAGESDDKELEELMADLDINDSDDIETIAKKSNAKVQKLVKYFTKQMTKVEDSAVEKATKDTREKEEAAIRKFSADNPGMKNQEVIDLMQPLYDKGKTLEEAYAVAIKALDLDPKTGEPLEDGKKDEEEEKEEAKGDEKSKEAKKELGAKSSAKSGAHEEEEIDDDEEEESSPMSLDEALAAASSEYTAKHGNPFE